MNITVSKTRWFLTTPVHCLIFLAWFSAVWFVPVILIRIVTGEWWASPKGADAQKVMLFAVQIWLCLFLALKAFEQWQLRGRSIEPHTEARFPKARTKGHGSGLASMIVIGLIFGVQGAQAHCDSLDGPVVKTAQHALETGNLFPVLAYAPASAEPEIRAAFEKSRKVRSLGPDARALADQSFFETVVRLHRAGEGAPYTGLKPTGIDYGPVIPAAEQAVETGDLTKLKAALAEAIDQALSQRLAHLRELQRATLEPKTAAEVPHARDRVSAELGFVTFAESIRQAALGKDVEQHHAASSSDTRYLAWAC